MPIEIPERHLITEGLWPRCPRCEHLASEILQTPSVSGSVTLTAVCSRCHQRDSLVVPVGATLRKTFWGIEFNEAPRSAVSSLEGRMLPGDRLVSGHRVGPNGGGYRICDGCLEEYEMLQDQVTHEHCFGRSSVVPAAPAARPMCGKRVSRASEYLCVLDPNHTEPCSATRPPEAKKDEEAHTTNRFSWLEVD